MSGEWWITPVVEAEQKFAKRMVSIFQTSYPKGSDWAERWITAWSRYLSRIEQTAKQDGLPTLTLTPYPQVRVEGVVEVTYALWNPEYQHEVLSTELIRITGAITTGVYAASGEGDPLSMEDYVSGHVFNQLRKFLSVEKAHIKAWHWVEPPTIQKGK